MKKIDHGSRHDVRLERVCELIRRLKFPGPARALSPLAMSMQESRSLPVAAYDAV